MIFRILLSILLIAIGFFQVKAIDNLEISFLYFGFGLNVSAVVIRIIISLLFTFSITIHFNAFYRKTLVLLLFYFTIGVFYSLFMLYSETPIYNSFVFGDSLLLSHSYELIFCCLMLLCLVYFLLVHAEHYFIAHAKQNLFAIALLFLSFVFIPVISPPDFLFFESSKISNEGQSFIGDSLFNTLKFDDNSMPQLSVAQPYLIYFVTPTCSMCKLLAQRTEALLRSGQLKQSPYFIILSSDIEGVEYFFSNAQYSLPVRYAIIQDFQAFVSLAGNQFPAIFLMKGTQFFAKMDFRNMSLNAMQHFLEPKQ